MKKLMMLLVLSMMGSLFAASFSYQGVLRDEKGEKLDNPIQEITFRLYDGPSSTEVLWARTCAVFLDSEGLFNIELSDSVGSPVEGVTANLDDVIALKGHAELYLGLTVKDSSGEIMPRQKLLPVPVAAFAQDVSLARNGFTVSGGVAKFGGNVEALKDITVGGSAIIKDLRVGNTTSLGEVNTTGALKAQGGVVIPKGQTITVQVSDSVTEPLIPKGTIWMWYGDANKIPSGWALCNGQNGTPDLGGRFPVGVGSRDGINYSKGSTGGEAKHKLTVNEMPKHKHSYSFKGADLDESWDSDNYFYDASNHYDNNNNTRYTDEAGGDQAHENRPPYLALYFIMKL